MNKYLIRTEYSATGEGFFCFLGREDAKTKEEAINLFFKNNNIDTFYLPGVETYNLDDKFERDCAKTFLQETFNMFLSAGILDSCAGNLFFKLHFNRS